MNESSSSLLLVLSRDNRGVMWMVFSSLLTAGEPTVWVGEFAIRIPVSCSNFANSSNFWS